MITSNNNYKLISIFLFFLITACSSNTASVNPITIVLSHYKLATIDSNSIAVKLLQAYPMDDGKNLPQNCANLYVCKKNYSGEVIFLFDFDRNTPRYKIDSESKDIVYSIYKKDVRPVSALNVKVFVPENFFIPKGSKYLVASLSNNPD